MFDVTSLTINPLSVSLAAGATQALNVTDNNTFNVVIDRYDSPVTLYLVNGDFVRRNGPDGRDAGPVPLDLRYRADWEPET